ncbi:hypothetical protein [Microbacterium sp. bgisy189]|uniref:hypothetical protein n=1 Tax=Microbacterium sp. bgisy189 TaxID=3413798 RepID=UPI003EBAA122
MGIRSTFTRIKQAIFGKPLTREQAQVQNENYRRAAQGSSAERGSSVQNQTFMF